MEAVQETAAQSQHPDLDTQEAGSVELGSVAKNLVNGIIAVIW